LSFASGTGGTVPGLSVEAGVALGKVLSVGGELTVPSRHESTQVSGYLFGPFQRKSRYRDLTIGAIARLQGPSSGVVRAALIGGFELVGQSSLQRQAEGRLGPDGTIIYESFGQEQNVQGWTTGAVVGGDVIVAASPHLAVVPQVRLHVIARDDVTQPLGTLGLTTRVWRVGVGMRATF
jgi:hypothetical protein